MEEVYNAIVGSAGARRTSARLWKEGLGGYVKEKTGLLIDAYFSGTKFKWMLDNVDGLWRAAGGLFLAVLSTAGSYGTSRPP